MRKYIVGLLDLLVIVIFVVIGRSVHGHRESFGGFVKTVAPFFAGLVVAWAINRPWKNSVEYFLRIWPTGTVICVTAALVGQLVRLIVGQGSAIPFVLVSVGFFALAMLGWRLIFSLIHRISSR